jgi:hypothetical protein
VDTLSIFEILLAKLSCKSYLIFLRVHIDVIIDSDFHFPTFFVDGDFNKLKQSADIGVLMYVAPDNSDYCGEAFHIDPLKNDEHIAVVRKYCSITHFSFGHEVAHLFGCEHNREQDNSTTKAHGYLLKPPVESGFRSIMG